MITKRKSVLLKVLSLAMFFGAFLAFVGCTGTESSTTITTAPTTSTTSNDATTVVPATTTTTTTTTTTQTTMVTTEVVTTEINLNATLLDLTVNGLTVVGFSPQIEDYVMVLSNDITATPLVEVLKYSSNATAIVTPADDVTSIEAEDRTTTITVTSEDTLHVTVYTVLFETSILPVDLGTAADFVILAESGISTATSSIITGDIGISPSAATYLTGFSLIMDSSGTFSTSSQLIGNAYASDYTTPTPSNLTTAISDMQTAYTDAAGRAAHYNELYSGDLSGKTLTTGVYKFGTGVLINTDLTLTGSATDVWIFQVSGQLTQAGGISIILAGGALAENIFWVVADTVSIGTGAHFEGTILAMTNISMGTNASINGNLYAQTAVTLDACTVTKP
ncbi:MAG: DUF3494 domain-containing protein [Bacilli bacterium]|nr:DUF3494 domain-containing protein [Bacilli bacterium]